MTSFVAYYRVSTARQGKSGLGLDAQRRAVTDYLGQGAHRLVGEFVEVESGKRDDRPELSAALTQCELTGATLIVAKLDRLSRNVAFLAALQEHGTPFLAADSLSRYVATTETSKHRWFTFLDAAILPDQKIRGIAVADAYDLGVLSSRFHTLWSDAAGGRQGVGNDPVYNNTACFDPFPFPADVAESLKDQIRTEAEALDALRKRVLADHADLTLTKLYNVLAALRANDGQGQPLTDAERDIHDRGLVTLIRQHHDAIDRLVAQAYGWPADVADQEILTRLVALNKERAAEEARGLVRWLRPEFQAPDYQAPITQQFDLGETAAVVHDNIIPWPTTLPEQVSAIQSVLASSPKPLRPQDVARAFKGKRAATVTPVLDALTGIGMARRLGDGRYAA